MTSAIREMNAVREGDATRELASRTALAVHPVLSAVFQGFADAHIGWRVLRGDGAVRAPGHHVDLLIDAAVATRVEVTLRELGFLRDSAVGRGSPMRFIKYDIPTDSWTTLDIATELAAGRSESEGARLVAEIGEHARGFSPQRLFRGRGISIALLGPDGAGKSTLAAGIRRSSHLPVKYVYMGLWQRNSDGRTWFDDVRGLAWLARLLRAWRRYAVARLYLAFGYLVIFDRYTFDALLWADSTPHDLRSIANWMLARCCPAPDLAFVLDAPGHVMYDRKGEHHPEYLEAQRQRFLLLSHRLPNAHAIDATRGEDAVRRDVMAHIWRHMSGRAGVRERTAGVRRRGD
jgi:thymidylate kinase